ncbi:MAG: LysR family transcriptional regulator [Pseudomonadota bacterium]
MDRLNYHHLRYFREVAHEGNLTRAADRLNISQSALSTQIKNLEARLEHDLFHREGRQLTLTEAGQIALDHADRIFRGGEELMAALGAGSPTRPLRVGAVSTLSRNFQLRFLRPVLAEGAELQLTSGSREFLVENLRSLALDIVLSTDAPGQSLAGDLVAHRLAEQPVGLYGVPAIMGHGSLKALLSNEAVILPTESSIRTGFDSLTARLGVTPTLAAEVDDMAMVRLLAREGLGVAVTPAVVLADELRAGLLQAAPFDLNIVETFYAITARRSFEHPLVRALLAD